MSVQSSISHNWKGWILTLFFFNIGISFFFAWMQAIRYENPYANLSGESVLLQQTRSGAVYTISDASQIDIGDDNTIVNLDKDHMPMYTTSTMAVGGEQVVNVPVYKMSSQFFSSFFSLKYVWKVGGIVATALGLSFAGVGLSYIFAPTLASTLWSVIMIIFKIGLGLVGLALLFPIYNNAVLFVADTIGTDIPWVVPLYSFVYWGLVIGMVIALWFKQTE